MSTPPKSKQRELVTQRVSACRILNRDDAGAEGHGRQHKRLRFADMEKGNEEGISVEEFALRAYQNGEDALDGMFSEFRAPRALLELLLYPYLKDPLEGSASGALAWALERIPARLPLRVDTASPDFWDCHQQRILSGLTAIANASSRDLRQWLSSAQQQINDCQCKKRRRTETIVHSVTKSFRNGYSSSLTEEFIPFNSEKIVSLGVCLGGQKLAWLVRTLLEDKRRFSGLPDLVLFKEAADGTEAGHFVKFVEVKSATDQMRPEQWAWAERLKQAGLTHEVHKCTGLALDEKGQLVPWGMKRLSILNPQRTAGVALDEETDQK